MLLVEGGRWCGVLYGGVVRSRQEYLRCLHFPPAVSNTNSYLNLCIYQNYELSQKIHGISSNLSSTRNEVRMKGKRNKAKCRESFNVLTRRRSRYYLEIFITVFTFRGFNFARRNMRRNNVMIATMVLFVVCWLPLNILNLGEDFNIPLQNWRYQIQSNSIQR